MEVFYICAVQYSNHQPHVAVQPLKTVNATEQLNSLLHFILSLKNYVVNDYILDRSDHTDGLFGKKTWSIRYCMCFGVSQI